MVLRSVAFLNQDETEKQYVAGMLTRVVGLLTKGYGITPSIRGFET